MVAKRSKESSDREAPSLLHQGWESFPSRKRLFEPQRLSLLYESPEACFDGQDLRGAAGFPQRWRPTKEPDSCYRCEGDWEATLLDTYERHLVSERIDVDRFQRIIPSMCVLFIVRDFGHTVFSHVPWDGGIRGHAMMMALQLAGLAHDAEHMPRGTWKVLHYDELEDERDYVDARATKGWLQLYFNLSVWRSNVSERAFTLRELEER